MYHVLFNKQDLQELEQPSENPEDESTCSTLKYAEFPGCTGTTWDLNIHNMVFVSTVEGNLPQLL